MGRRRKFEEDTVLRRALELFWEVGYAACSLDMLTSRMGIARPSLYHAFGSKAQLFLRCFRYYERGAGGFIWRSMREERLGVALALFLDGIARESSGMLSPKGFFLSLAMTDDYQKCESIKRFVVSRRRFYEDLVIRRLRQAGTFREPDDARTCAAMLFIIADGISVAARIGDPLPALQARAQFALEHLLPTGAPPPERARNSAAGLR